MQEGRLKGHILRDAFEQVNKGCKTFCGGCGKQGIIGEDCHIVYSETSTPFGTNYSVWGICGQCEKEYPRKK
jgi:hypothetical protein